MLLFGKETTEGFCQVDASTKSVFICLFGFLKHDDHEALQEFFKEQAWPVISAPLQQIPINSVAAVEAYQVVDRRTVDTAYVLTKPFASLAEGQDFLQKRMMDSAEDVRLKMFNEIEVIDVDKFTAVVTAAKQQAAVKRVADQDRKRRKDLIDQEEQAWQQSVQAKFANDPEMLEYLRQRFK